MPAPAKKNRRVGRRSFEGLVAFQRAIASPATRRGENQKYAKKKRETFMEIRM